MKLNRSFAVLAMAHAVIAAAPPQITNAKLVALPISGMLKAEIQTLLMGKTSPLWIGYSVPITGEHRNCCWSSDGNVSARGCDLEGGRLELPPASATSPVQLEPPKDAFILFRAENGSLQKIRTFTSDCLLDGGGLDFIWLTGAKPADSVAFLDEFVGNAGKTRDDGHLARSALGAIALHADISAQAVLESHLSTAEPESIRRQVVYSMAWRGDRGFQVLENLSKDSDDRIREAAAHALSATKGTGAAQLLGSIAASDKSGRVRGAALIGLATLRANIAAQTIQHAVETDPDRQVQHSGIAALQMLPPEQGIPTLIGLVRSTKSSEIRRAAMQQLGHSRDPHARQFINEILSK